MNIKILLTTLTVFFFSLFFLYFWTDLLRGKKVVQVQKSYGPALYISNDKGSVPSLGGVVFCISALIGIVLNSFAGAAFLSQVEIWILPFACSVVGFSDDWIKYSRNSSEGLTSLQKLIFQVIIAFFWSLLIFKIRGLELFPGIFVKEPVLALLLLVFFTVGMMNAVNVTDGLDGLVAGTGIISLSGILFLSNISMEVFVSICTGLAFLAGFMWHNCHPARIFMGDTGSHFIAGLIISICVYSGSFVYVVPSGFLFGLEIISVCIQLFAIYVAGQKVFLMSPVHHHFEIKGWSESCIVTRFWIVHGIGFAITFLAINILFSS